MTDFRPFRNADSPALVKLWNRGAPDSVVARPLTVHEFDSHVLGGPCFDREGLIVAVRDGRIVGYVHAGFGPESLGASPLELSRSMGTIAMLVVDPDAAGGEVEGRLVAQAEAYLRRSGAEVFYAGGRYPINPYYWGVYGGSEWSGILGGHDCFQRAVTAAGYQPVGSSLLLEAELSGPEVRDPRAVLMRRQVVLEVVEDALPRSWWDTLAVGDFRPTSYQLLLRADQSVVARAVTWDMNWFGRRDGLPRLGLIDMEVHPDHRRKGFGRHLVNEVLRLARAESGGVVAVQTDESNHAAIALYQGAGFLPVETATLYRKAGGAPSS